jgi:2-polyprenyl-3-methyl-5-hydroxy-6-metoxy-1,4-benzoquinol methylase
MVPRDAITFLDVGAGSGIFGFILSRTRDCKRLDAIEPFGYELDHFHNVYKMTWQEWFSKNTILYDVIISTECIEHMSKEDAISFLDEVKYIAKNIIIATPIKFEEQKPYDGNEYQRHKCVISESEFIERGYKTLLFNDSIIAHYGDIC